MDSATSTHKATIKIKDESGRFVKKINKNLEKVIELLEDNKKLLLNFVSKSFEVV